MYGWNRGRRGNENMTFFVYIGYYIDGPMYLLIMKYVSLWILKPYNIYIILTIFKLLVKNVGLHISLYGIILAMSNYVL